MEKSLPDTRSYGNRVLAVICLAAALVPFMGSAVNLSLPQIAREYDMSGILQSWILTAFLITSAIFQVPFGKLADMIGKKTVFISGLAVITVSSLLCALPYGGIYLIICRILQGIGSAMIFGTGMAIITETFSSGGRGKALGINAAVVYLSLALGPSLGGFIAYKWGWQGIFIVIAAVCLITCAGAFFIIKKQDAEAKGEPFDIAGSVMYGTAMILVIYGFTILYLITGIVLITAGIILFVCFIRYEKRAEYPVLNVKLFFSNRVFTYSSLAALINYAVTFPIAFFMSLYLQEVKGFPVQYAGLILIVQPSVQALLSPLAGYLSDRIRSHYLASAGMGIISASLLFISLFITPGSSLVLIVSLLVMLGIGFAAFSSPNTNIIMNSVDKRDYSMASATTGTMRLTGQAFSMGITTMVLALFLSGARITPEAAPEFMRTMKVGFIIFASLSSLGIYASMARNNKEK